MTASRRAPSALARWTLLAYATSVVYASLYPLTGWRDNGVTAFAYLFETWPRHLLVFDMAINVAGYMPLGLLVVFALYPRVRGAPALALAVASCAMLSMSMEALQTFLPSRVADNVDVVTNTSGGALGALLALRLAAPILERGRLLQIRAAWFEREASRGLLLSAFWFVAVLYPETFALGCGNFVKALESDLGNEFGLVRIWAPDPQQFEASEFIACMALLSGSAMLFTTLLRNGAPKRRLALIFVAATLLAKTIAVGASYAPNHPLVWATDAAVAGIATGTLVVLLSTILSPPVRARLALWLIALALIIINLVPDNPYFDALSRAWAYGRMLNFSGFAQGISLAWPFVALTYLAYVPSRLARRARHL